MFIGHFAVAFLLINMFPDLNPLIALIGVSFPDLLWGLTVLLGIEKVELSDSPFQKDIKFLYYPYSHSLVLGGLISAAPAIILAAIVSPLAGVVFVAASVSHWILDIFVHLPDLPILGFGDDRKIGLRLWNHPKTTFFLEYGLYAAGTLFFLPQASWFTALAIGAFFHLINSNSFFGFSENQIKSANLYAVFALVGFLGISFTLYFFL